ncbi:MAG TPA: thymidylate synthase [Sedimentisphaerales bacterium]|nr:thymidylate synthase [Sedimentisphaerales bacterium]
MTAALPVANIPVIAITAVCLPEAWEKAVLAVWDKGLELKTQYDKPEDPPSKDATVIVTITDPFGEPRIHKNFPGGPEELESYRLEVLSGIHDHWIDPAAGKWTYTYHERLFAYSPVEDIRSADSPKPFKKVDQIQYIVDRLSQAGHSRRAQAVTWMPTADPQTDDPPCLQRIWCRLVPDDAGRLSLNMNTHWRSRDLYKAWFMNVYALTDLQRIIAERISQKINQPVKVGRYVDISDSLHIYGSYFDEVAGEVEKMRQSPFSKRAWESTHPAFAMMTAEAREKLAKDPDYFAKPTKDEA